MPSRISCTALVRRALICLPFAIAPRLGAQETPASVTLQQAIDRALQRGYQARAAAAVRDADHFRDRAFYSRLLPQLSVTGAVPTFNRSIIEVVQPDGTTLFQPQNQTSAELTATVSQTLPFTGGDLFVSSSLSRLSISDQQDFVNWSSTPVSFGVRQPIFRPNTAGWNRREQPFRSELAERRYREAREDIALQITVLFFDVYAAQVALDNAINNAAVNDTLYTLNQGRFSIGRIGENDLLQSELALLQARTALDGALLEDERTLAALRLGLNLPPDAPFEIEVPTIVPTFDADTAIAVAEAFRNRAIVSDAALQGVQAERRIVEARLNNGFGATLQASYGFNATAPELSGAYRNLLEAQRLTLLVEIPLLQWGAGKEEVQAAEADRDEIANLTQANLEQTGHEARFAALQLSQARRNLVLSATADTVAERRFEVAYNRYLIGRISIDNLFIGQREKDQANTQYVRALRGYWEAYYRLRRVTLFDFERGEVIR